MQQFIEVCRQEPFILLRIIEDPVKHGIQNNGIAELWNKHSYHFMIICDWICKRYLFTHKI